MLIGAIIFGFARAVSATATKLELAASLEVSLDEPQRGPWSVRMESQLADPETLFTPGQQKAVRTAINYCSTVGLKLADYSRLLGKIADGRVLSKRDRRRLGDVLNRHAEERLTPSERRLNAWGKSDLWDAHRPSDGDSR